MRDVSSDWLDARGTPWCYREDCARLARTGKPFVINLDDKSGPGTHWVAARLIGKTLLYADPFGTILNGYPPAELASLADRVVANRIAWQHPDTNLCGYYAHLFTKGLQKANASSSVADLEHKLWRAIM